MTYRIRNVGIAVALAVVAALLTLLYVTNYKRNVQNDEQLVTIYVAGRDIPIGTAGSDLRGSWLRTSEVARRSVTPGAISDLDQIRNLVATQPIYAGEQVTTRRFRPVEEQGIRGQIKGNTRAFQLPGEEHQLLAGTLQTGDHVDVVGTWEFPEGRQHHVSRVVLRDVLVLKPPSSGRVTGKLTSASREPFSAMVAVTDRQAQKLFWLVQNGEWSLQLRPPRASADSPERVETASSLLGDGLPPAQVRQQLTLAERSRR
jgi:pilus assembly protein CpaB